MTGSARPWTHAALFGGLWGTLEATAGTVLKASRVPLSGLIMASLALVCLLTLRRLEPRAGVLLTAGAAAALVKVFTLGGLYAGPLVAILLEAATVELAFLVAGTTRLAAVLGGATAFGLAPVQMFVTVRLVAGREAVEAAAEAGRSALGFLGLSGVAPAAVLGAVVLASAAAGAAAGAAAWRVAGRVRRRVRGAP